MPKYKKPICTIKKGNYNTQQHCCSTYRSYYHMICCFNITTKETGAEWDGLAFPGNCVKYHKNPKNYIHNLSTLKGG